MVLRSLKDGQISIDGPVEPVAGLRVLIVRQAVFVDVSNPDETFGRPDVPNHVCGALCAFQPYNASASAAAGGAAGRLFWGLVSVQIQVQDMDRRSVVMGTA